MRVGITGVLSLSPSLDSLLRHQNDSDDRKPLLSGSTIGGNSPARALTPSSLKRGVSSSCQCTSATTSNASSLFALAYQFPRSVAQLPLLLWMELPASLLYLLIGPWILACLGSKDGIEDGPSSQVWGALTWHGIYLSNGHRATSHDTIMIMNIQMVRLSSVCWTVC